MLELAICERFGWPLSEVRALPASLFRDIQTYMRYAAATRSQETPHAV